MTKEEREMFERLVKVDQYFLGVDKRNANVRNVNIFFII